MTGKQAIGLIAACGLGAGSAAACSEADEIKEKSKAIAVGAGLGALIGLVALSKDRKKLVKELAEEGLGFAANFLR